MQQGKAALEVEMLISTPMRKARLAVLEFHFPGWQGQEPALRRSPPFHDRMPLILDHSKDWLDLEQYLLENLRPLPAGSVLGAPMNPAMNRPAVKDLALIKQ